METDNYPAPDGVDEAEANRNRMLRKRTKTGCLTCRKRRIKCGEERPICKNCIKSKRHCDGYNHRVVFKPTTIDFRHLQNGAATITFPASTMGMDVNLGPGYPFQVDPYQMTGPARLPRPIVPMTPSDAYPYSVPYTAPPFQTSWQGNFFDDPNTQAQVNAMQQMAMSQAAHQNYLHQPQFQQDDLATHHAMDPNGYGMGISNGEASIPRGLHTPAMNSNGSWSHHQHHDPNRQSSVATSGSIPPLTMSSIESTPSWNHNNQPPTPHSAPLLNTPWLSGQYHTHMPMHGSHPFISSDGAMGDSPDQAYKMAAMSPSALLDTAAIEYHDVDYYDVHPEEEPDAFLRATPEPVPKEALAVDHIVKVGDLRISHGLRSNYGYSEGILDNYRPEMTANPLKNPATARVFAHFIQVTGLTISAQTRRPLPPGAQKRRQDVPFSEAGIWTHTMPMAALHDQGLLQAMLALSSLHIAKLTGASTTPSYKHYAYALKAVHHSVGHPNKRHNVPTLAASILLAVYELWCAEHVKWSSHLAGAGQLLIETDFAGMHKKVRQLKLEKQREKRRGYPTFRRAAADGDFPQHLKTKAKQFRDLEQVPDIDPQVVSIMSGSVVNYDDYGQILGEDSNDSDKHASLDVPKFEILKDLFWGFAKHDMIGSIISGNPLLMSYGRWTDYPPRAPIDAEPGVIYGAYDHLMLLCGRIADFIVRDRKRKLRAMQLNGGMWKPPPGMQLGPPPGSSPGGPPGSTPGSSAGGPRPGGGPPGFGPPSTGTPRGPPSAASGQPSPQQASNNTPSPQLPPYFGMAPPRPTAPMPSSYWAQAEEPPIMSPEQEQFIDFTTQTNEALQEWNEIMNAINVLVSMLGEWYQPLESEYQVPPQTPWGPATIYKSLDVGCLWGFVNFAYISAHRCHPHMPPYAHMAAAIAARSTKQYADNIGRLAAGIMPPNNGKPITPFMGAAMCDLCLPLFWAGVQLVDPHQRDWIITALFDIERRCAYETAGTIAHGCQTAWHKAGKAGRGPPYTHRYNTRAQDERLNGSWEKIDPDAQPDQDDVTDRRFIQTKPTARLHWAMGVLETELDGHA